MCWCAVCQSKAHDGLKRQQVHVTGVISHGHHRAWALLSGDEVFHNSNLTIEYLHRVLVDLAQDGPLPRRLFLQLDNCGRSSIRAPSHHICFVTFSSRPLPFFRSLFDSVVSGITKTST